MKLENFYAKQIYLGNEKYSTQNVLAYNKLILNFVMKPADGFRHDISKIIEKILNIQTALYRECGYKIWRGDYAGSH
jgi:hypothetical protein